MRGVAGRRVLAIIAFVLLTLGAIAATRLVAAKGLVWATYMATILAAAFAAGPAFRPLRKLSGWLTGAPPGSGLTLAAARAGYAAALDKQWAREEHMGQVQDPPLPVRWKVAGGQAPWSGDIRATFTDMAARRLVILGPGGAGKSVLAIKLVRDLLKSRQPEDPVPVVLAAASWTRDSTMTEWIAEQLVKSQPALGVQINTDLGEKAWLPRELAESGLIPVIDGLDELPADRWTAVISEINAWGAEYPLVLTSRPEEYHAATAARGISRAVVIELEPLEVPEIEGYLTEVAGPADRWQPVFERLAAEPGGALAQTLGTPLMIWLARTIYEHEESRPGELALLADREAIEAHLVREFVPAVYSSRRTRRRPGSFECSPEQATRWLGFLAHRLDRRQEQDIAWWQLALSGRGVLAVSVAVRTTLYAAIAWQLGIWVLTRRGYYRHGAYVGHGHYQDLLLAGPLGQAIRPVTNAVIRLIGFVVSASSSAKNPSASLIRRAGETSVRQQSTHVDGAFRIVTQLGWLPIAGVGAACGVLAALLMLLGRTLPAPRHLGLNWRRFLLRLVSLFSWLLVVVFIGWEVDDRQLGLLAVVRTQAGWAALLWLGLKLVERIVPALKTPAELSAATDPVGLLRADRRVYLASLVGSAARVGTLWLWSGGVLAAADAIRYAIGLCVVLLFGGITGGAWECYADGRLRLAILRWMPWRAVSFLADAHTRGVLRQTGAVYQFRHIRLQQRLAAGYSPWPRPLRPAVAWTGRLLARARTGHPLLVPEPLTTAPAATAATEYTAALAGGAIRRVQTAVLLFQVLIMVALFVVEGLFVSGPAAFMVSLIDLLLVATVVLAFDKIRASALLPPGGGTLHVAPQAITVMQGPRQIRLVPDDAHRIAVRPIGTCWLSFAVYAQLRSDDGAPQEWLPLFWTPRYTARIPLSLVSALAGFAGRRLDPELADWLSRQAAVGYGAYGTVEVKSLFSTLGRYLGQLLLALVVTGVSLKVHGKDVTPFAIIADIVFGGICFYQLRLRAYRKRLPPGPWSIQVTSDAIELTRSGRAVRLTPSDVERIEYRPIHRSSPAYTPIYARLRPPAAKRLNVTDGWYLLYWTASNFTLVPAELIKSLAIFAPGRLAGPLKRSSKRALAPSAPVDRSAWPPAGLRVARWPAWLGGARYCGQRVVLR